MPTLDEIEARPLDDAAKAAGVTSDRTVRMPGLEKARKLRVTLREVVVAGSDGKPVRLLTNLLDVPAHVIALLYRYRWQVELLFKWLKSYGNFNHLISHRREGVLLNFYVAIIGVMLMYLHTGYRPGNNDGADGLYWPRGDAGRGPVNPARARVRVRGGAIDARCAAGGQEEIRRGSKARPRGRKVALCMRRPRPRPAPGSGPAAATHWCPPISTSPPMIPPRSRTILALCQYHPAGDGGKLAGPLTDD